MSEKEVWETTSMSRVAVWTTGPKGQEHRVEVGGQVGSRLRITPEDREMNEDQVRSSKDNPFRNGMLIQTGGPVTAESPNHISNADLIGWYARETFVDDIQALNEVNARRLLSMSDEGARNVSQVKALKDMINERWPVTSGDTPVYREIMAINPDAGGPGLGTVTVR